MSTALIGILAIATLVMAKLWRDSKAEVATLRASIASLKRRLARQGRAP
jgi:DNA-binding winged helix-turn-helix (wHTH) protein